MADSDPKLKKEENPFIDWNNEASFTIIPLRSKTFSMDSISALPDGETRISPESISEAGIICRCITCNYQAGQEIFMSKNKMIFTGCPECGQIDRSKILYITSEGIVPNEANSHPQNFEKDFSKYVDHKEPHTKPRPVQHQLRTTTQPKK